MRDMEWYVYVGDWNGKKVEKYNIFDHSMFMDDVKKAYKKHNDDYDAFCVNIRKSLAYYFWSKCEWEVIVSSWPESDRVKPIKTDVYQQVMMNKDVFFRYVWDMAHARKQRKKV